MTTDEITFNKNRQARPPTKSLAVIALLLTALLFSTSFSNHVIRTSAEPINDTTRTPNTPYIFEGYLRNPEGALASGVTIYGYVEDSDGMRHDRLTHTTNSSGRYVFVFAYWLPGDKAVFTIDYQNMTYNGFRTIDNPSGDYVRHNITMQYKAQDDQNGSDNGWFSSTNNLLLLGAVGAAAVVIILFLVAGKRKKEEEPAQKGYEKERKRSR